MRVLLVDDEESILTTVRSALEAAGHDVDTATDGDGALARFAETPADIVVSDIKMPTMDGLELLRRLRVQNPDLPVVMITGHGDEDTAIDALHQGAFDYLRKPFRLRGLLATLDRAHEQRRLEQQLQEERSKLVHAHRLASIGTLAAGIAHEVNNPATFIKSNIEILHRCWDVMAPVVRKAAEERPADRALGFAVAEMDDLISGMASGVERITALVRDMGALSRRERNQRPRIQVTLQDCVGEAVSMVRANLPEGTDLQVDVVDAALVTGDAPQICQVLMNLLSNAGHAVADVPRPRIEVSQTIDGPWARVCVRDNGGGIPADIREHIFDPFFTTKEPGEGTGLGLAVCHGIIRDHGGEISFDSREGEGTEFWIRLPRAPAAASPQTRRETECKAVC